MQKDIGGYFGLELKNGSLYHSDCVMLNSCRNALRYLIRAYNIKKLNVPYYTCPVLFQAIEKENCKLELYEIDKMFYPKKIFKNDDYILYTNYFGICSSNIKKLVKKYPNLIIDNAMAFYSPYNGLASIYSPRKFFGTADGGILKTEKLLNEKFDKSQSYQRFSHLLKRIDCDAEFGYSDFNYNENQLSIEPIKKMSNLTFNMLKSIDYEYVKNKRLNNFKYLKKSLDDFNMLKIKINKTDVPAYYPLLVKEAAQIRKEFLAENIYCPQPWRGLSSYIRGDGCENEKMFYDYLIPLIIDQRCGIDDMDKMLKIIKKVVKQNE